MEHRWGPAAVVKGISWDGHSGRCTLNQQYPARIEPGPREDTFVIFVIPWVDEVPREIRGTVTISFTTGKHTGLYVSEHRP